MRNIAQLLRENADLDAAEGGNPDVCQLERAAADHIDSLTARVAELEKDAARWRMFETALRTRIPGPGHGTRIKVVEISPMYGEEKDVQDVRSLVDAALLAKGE